MSIMNFLPINIKLKHIIPRAHGAWAMWITPLILGMLFSGFTPGGLLLFFTALTLFITHHPVTMTLQKRKTRQFNNYLAASIMSSVTFVILGGFLIYQHFSIELLYIGCATVVILGIHLLLVKLKMGMTAMGQMTGIAGLTLTAPAVYLINTGTINESSLILWFINFLYFSSTIPYIRLKIRVQSKIHGQITILAKLKMGIPAITMSVIPVVIMIIVGLKWMILPFIPGLLKSIWGTFMWLPGEKVRASQLGIIEFIFTVVFILLTWWGLTGINY